METLKKRIYLGLGIVLIIWSFYTFLNSPAPARYQKASSLQLTASSLKIGDKYIPVEIADNNEERALGLSNRTTLPSGQGLLFMFETPGIYGFWMKDMRFPIDIVWIDEEWRVIGVEREVAPDTYPSNFTPPSPAKYVLELNSGEAVELGIDAGVRVSPNR